jgi:hypothetical protein
VDLQLSDAQKEIFAGWRRPTETFGSQSADEHWEVDRHASVMAAVHEMDLVQDITTDCSVVASLCALTARTEKGHGKVIPLLHCLNSLLKFSLSSLLLQCTPMINLISGLEFLKTENIYFVSTSMVASEKLSSTTDFHLQIHPACFT